MKFTFSKRTLYGCFLSWMLLLTFSYRERISFHSFVFERCYLKVLLYIYIFLGTACKSSASDRVSKVAFEPWYQSSQVHFIYQHLAEVYLKHIN